MRTPRTVLAALALGTTVLLAACQSLTPQTTAPTPIEQTLFRAGSEAAPSPTVTWDHAGPVEILGAGMGDRYGATNNPAEIVIGDLASAMAVRVQVAVKYGFVADPDNMIVEFRNSADEVLASVAVADTKSAVTGDFFEAELPLRGVDAVNVLPDGIIRAEVINGVSFDRGGEDFHTPRAFVAFVLRDDVTPSVQSKGLTSYEDVYHYVTDGGGDPTGFIQTLIETISFDPDAADRDLRIDFAISELDPDPRVIDVIVRVDGATVYDERLTAPNAGAELYLGQVLTTLPAGATDVEIELFSPDPSREVEGDSVWLAGVNAAVSTPERGLEGCTPGYWRNHSADAPGNQEDAWIPTGFTGDQRFGDADVFDRTVTIRLGGSGRPVSVENPTLLEAVVAAGGGESALARHAVAALLNAAHPDVNYPYTVEEVIQMVQDALDGVGPLDVDGTKDLLDENNNLGCPL